MRTIRDLSVDMKGLSGYLLDCSRIATFTFTHPHSYTKFLLINAVRKRTKARIFVESGTYFGVTARRCARVFDCVYTIELDGKLAEEASRALADCHNVTVIHGDAQDVLSVLLAEGGMRNVLVFLDGHFSGGITARGAVAEPAVEEIKGLARHRSKIAAIVCDDFRVFGPGTGVPTKTDLVAVAETEFATAGFEVVVHLDQLIIMRRD